MVRMTQHKYNIWHFLEHGWESFRVMVLQANPQWSGLKVRVNPAEKEVRKTLDL